jgi:hypothetical protein
MKLDWQEAPLLHEVTLEWREPLKDDGRTYEVERPIEITTTFVGTSDFGAATYRGQTVGHEVWSGIELTETVGFRLTLGQKDLLIDEGRIQKGRVGMEPRYIAPRSSVALVFHKARLVQSHATKDPPVRRVTLRIYGYELTEELANLALMRRRGRTMASALSRALEELQEQRRKLRPVLEQVPDWRAFPAMPF